MSFFQKGAKMVRKSGVVIVVWLISLTVTIIGAAYFLEDYQTSVRGYQMVPTRHHYEAIIWIGALTPQVGMVFFTYLGADQPDRWWAWLASLSLLFVDSATDLFFKCDFGNSASIVASVVDIVIMYNICSEGFLALGTGMTLELFPDMVNALRNLKERLTQQHGGNWGMLRGSAERSRSRNTPGRGSWIGARPPTQSHVPSARPSSHRPDPTHRPGFNPVSHRGASTGRVWEHRDQGNLG